jgi:hypothetical protein
MPAIIIPFTFKKTDRQTPATGISAGSSDLLKIRTTKRAGKFLRPALNDLPALQLPAEFLSGAPWAALPAEISPGLMEFAKTLENGDASLVRGVYAEDVLALPVIQQPPKNSAFVSPEWGEVTEFSSARRNRIIGLLAHNYLSGGRFYSLEMGQEIWIVYGDWQIRGYQLQSVDSFQKLHPASLQSDFIQLSTGKKMTTEQVFNQFYKGEHKVTLQTCLEKNGISNWGLTFWTATPLP